MESTKELFSLGFLCLFMLSACQKSSFDAQKQVAKDDSLIVDFITQNNIQATKHKSGLYYQVINQGDGANINTQSTVGVNYEGRLLNGHIFDKSEQILSFSLNRVIEGWAIGMPLIKVGGRLRLIIPSGLAYGNQSPGADIPKNSVLDFTIDLLYAN